VDVVVVEDVVVVDVVGALVVEVEVDGDLEVGSVVVAESAALEQPPMQAARPSIIMNRLATAGLERTMSLLVSTKLADSVRPAVDAT